MRQKTRRVSDRRVQAALQELRDMILQRYPSATFVISRDADEPGNIHLVPTVDVDDPDEVLDLVMERLLELQDEERLPVHVIPIRAPERVLAGMAARQREPRWPVRQILSRRFG